ncbi:TPA: hypothetical protein KRM61_000862 [Clostridioides difficile]|nr:hypothetical protein [Clostridioides difficile]HBF8167674.1 hypothetical protein [Clostridioides difficile]HBH1807236.1 hypothetical protein [Clostridioides difficile]
MKLKMIDNAIDLLKLVKEFFYNYNTNKKHKQDNIDLELTIIYLHKSIELLLESILINENELLIYENLPPNKLDEYKKIRNHPNIILFLDEFLMKREGIETIDYTKLITIYCDTFNANKKTQIVLSDLGKLKNSAIYFGIDNSDNFDVILITIYETINIILDVLYKDLKKIDNSFEYEDVRGMLYPLVESYNNIFAPIS